MASFRAKIGWKRPRKREYKTYHSVPFRPYSLCNRNSKKNKKFKKLKNTIMASFQAKIGWKRLKKIENLNYRSVLFPFDV